MLFLSLVSDCGFLFLRRDFHSTVGLLAWALFGLCSRFGFGLGLYCAMGLLFAYECRVFDLFGFWRGGFFLWVSLCGLCGGSLWRFVGWILWLGYLVWVLFVT